MIGKISGFLNKKGINNKHEMNDDSVVYYEDYIDYDKYFGESCEIHFLSNKMVEINFSGLIIKVPKNKIKIYHNEGDDLEDNF